MKRIEIVVKQCKDCPFFERAAISIIADLVAKREVNSGACKYNSNGLVWPFRRTHVEDETKVPPTCPLRDSEAIIRIGADA